MMRIHPNNIFDKCLCTLLKIFMCIYFYHWPCWISYIITSTNIIVLYNINSNHTIHDITVYLHISIKICLILHMKKLKIEHIEGCFVVLIIIIMIRKLKGLCISPKPLSTTQKMICVAGGTCIAVLILPIACYSVGQAVEKIDQQFDDNSEIKKKFVKIVTGEYFVLSYMSISSIALSIGLLHNYKELINAYKSGANRCYLISGSTQFTFISIIICFSTLVSTYMFRQIYEQQMHKQIQENCQ